MCYVNGGHCDKSDSGIQVGKIQTQVSRYDNNITIPHNIKLKLIKDFITDLNQGGDTCIKYNTCPMHAYLENLTRFQECGGKLLLVYLQI